MEENESVKMALPCLCPHCGHGIVVEINQPYPLVDILTPDELPEEVKDAIINSKNDITEEPEAA